MSDGVEFPAWDSDKPAESLASVYQWAVRRARDHIGWYVKRQEIKKRWSQRLRALSIIFAAAGAICPLVKATEIFNDAPLLGQWGYVSLAMAAAFVSYDRFFGLSSGWMRYAVTQLSLEKTLKEFQYDWMMLIAERQSNDPLKLLQRVRDFSLQVDTAVQRETDAWVAEFQRNIAELEKRLKTEAEARKPGAIRVRVSNAGEYDRIVIFLNGSQMKEMVGVTEGVLDSVPPGRYEITVIGRKGDRESKESRAVEVQAGLTASAEMTLPCLKVNGSEA